MADTTAARSADEQAPTARPRRHRALALLTGIPRTLAGGILIAAGALTMARQLDIRSFEANAFASWVNHAGPSFAPVYPMASIVYIHSGPSSFQGLNITPECTSAFLIAPILLLAGAMALLARRRSIPRIITAATIATAVLLTANQLRIAMIAEFIRRWGMGEGYPIAHRVLGSLLILFAVVLAYVLYFAFVCREHRPARAERS
jgi:exosortase/archaeosortase family protein